MKVLILIIFLIFSAASFSKVIVCKTSNDRYTYHIDGVNIKVTQDFKNSFNSDRKLSSTLGNQTSRAQTSHVGKEIIKVINLKNGLKHKINIKDISKFSDVNDSVSISRSAGPSHEFTMTLKCNNKL